MFAVSAPFAHDDALSVGILALAEGCEHLCELYMDTCSGVSDHGISALAQKCVGLKHFQVTGHGIDSM